MAEKTVHVEGLAELQRALKRMDAEINKEINQELRGAAKIVSDDARSRLAPLSTYSAMGIRPRVRGFGRAYAEQSRRKTTGDHPEWGSVVMRRALLPALASKEDEVVDRLDRMLGRLEGRF